MTRARTMTASFNIERATRRYLDGWTLKRVAESEHVSLETARRRLLKSGVTIRSAKKAQLSWKKWSENNPRQSPAVDLTGLSPSQIINKLSELMFTVKGTRRIRIDPDVRKVLVDALKGHTRMTMRPPHREITNRRERVIKILWEKQFEGSPWHDKFHLIRLDSLEADYGALADKIIKAVVDVERMPQEDKK